MVAKGFYLQLTKDGRKRDLQAELLKSQVFFEIHSLSNIYCILIPGTKDTRMSSMPQNVFMELTDGLQKQTRNDHITLESGGVTLLMELIRMIDKD